MSTDSVGSSFGHRAGRAASRVIIALVLLGLLGAVAFLVSQLNARTYSLSVVDGKLTVMKGRMFPVGSEPFRPTDARLAEAYAPISLEGQSAKSLMGQRFSDRDQLDRALFDFLRTEAKPLIASDDASKVDEGLSLLARMGKLDGASQDQRASLTRMKAEVAYAQAKLRLVEARELLGQALSQLQVAADGADHHAEVAAQMVSTIKPAAEQLETALRKVRALDSGAALPAATNETADSDAAMGATPSAAVPTARTTPAATTATAPTARPTAFPAAATPPAATLPSTPSPSTADATTAPSTSVKAPNSAPAAAN